MAVNQKRSYAGYLGALGENPAAAPVNTVAPTITGTPEVGTELTATRGTWTGNPAPDTEIQWFAGNDVIIGADQLKFTPTMAEGGKAIKVRILASNGEGSAFKDSVATAAVAYPPVVNERPEITVQNDDDLLEGSTLVCDSGTWLALPAVALPVGITYQWTRDGEPIENKTASTYKLVADDNGALIGCEVTATNAQGDETETATIGPIPFAPVNDEAPTIKGDAKAWRMLVADPGAWLGYPEPAISYQWQTNASGSYVNIAGETNDVYRPTDDDIGDKVQCIVTATNDIGTASETAGPTATITADE